MRRLLRSLMVGTILGVTVTATSTWSAPGDEFRSDLDIWADQLRADSQRNEQQHRLEQLEQRMQRMEGEQRAYRETQQKERERERGANDLKDFKRAHPYGQGLWESERSGR